MRDLPAAVTMLLVLSGCAAVEGSQNPAVPRNYRTLVAANLAETVNSVSFVKAEISDPDADNGLAPASARPVVCVRVTTEAGFGLRSNVVGYLFMNGQIDTAFNPSDVNPKTGGNAASCGKQQTYGPFPEFAPSKG